MLGGHVGRPQMCSTVAPIHIMRPHLLPHCWVFPWTLHHLRLWTLIHKVGASVKTRREVGNPRAFHSRRHASDAHTGWKADPHTATHVCYVCEEARGNLATMLCVVWWVCSTARKNHRFECRRANFSLLQFQSTLCSHTAYLDSCRIFLCFPKGAT